MLHAGELQIEVEADQAYSQRVALVHDYLTQRGGAERVVLAMARAFPASTLHTSLYDAEGTFPEFADLDISTRRLDRVWSLRQRHRLALPFLATTFSRLFIEADVLLCSSSGWAHGARTHGRKVVYCHNPARWLYQADDYIPGPRSPARVGMAAMQGRLLDWDRQSALTVDRYLVNSTIVRDRVRAAYGVDAEVLPPPTLVQPWGGRRPVEGLEPGYLLCVARLLPYKNVDAVVDAFRSLPDERLVVVGMGPALGAIRAMAGPNVTLAGTVADDELRWLYANATGLVAASYEDFGLTPLEAAAFGKPAAALRWGGFLDTLVEGRTGVFFDEPTPLAIADAVRELGRERWDATVITRHADQFSEANFAGRLRQVVTEEVGLAAVDPTSAAAGSRPEPERRVPSASSRIVQRRWATKAAVATVDVLGVAVALASAFVVWSALRVDSAENFQETHGLAALVALPVWLASLAYAGMYRSRLLTSAMDELRRLVRAVAVAVVLTAAAASITRLPVARLWLLLSFLFGVAVLGAERLAVRSVFRRLRQRGLMLRPVVVVGGNEEAAELCAMFSSDRSLGYRVVGHVDDRARSGPLVAGGPPKLGSVDQTLDAVRRTGATGAVIATTAVDHDTSNRLIRRLGDAGVHVELSSSLRDIAARRLSVRPVGRFPIVYVEPTERGGWRAAAKRVFDVVLSVILLALLSPLLAAAAVAVKAGSRGPVLRRERRFGLHGSTFGLLLLRTTTGPDGGGGGIRTTRVGQVLARFSVDDLPQLWNVLRGDMSLVGPRPSTPSQFEELHEELHSRLWVKPGITGMWQVNGANDQYSEEYARLDVYYVENWSLLTDLAILARTVPAVLRGTPSQRGAGPLRSAR